MILRYGQGHTKYLKAIMECTGCGLNEAINKYKAIIKSGKDLNSIVDMATFKNYITKRHIEGEWFEENTNFDNVKFLDLLYGEEMESQTDKKGE